MTGEAPEHDDVGVLGRAADHEVLVGREALVGFDDIEWMSLVRPSITVVDQPVSELGRRAAERLIARIQGDAGSPGQIRLAARLLVRRSSDRPFAD